MYINYNLTVSNPFEIHEKMFNRMYIIINNYNKNKDKALLSNVIKVLTYVELSVLKDNDTYDLQISLYRYAKELLNKLYFLDKLPIKELDFLLYFFRTMQQTWHELYARGLGK